MGPVVCILLCASVSLTIGIDLQLFTHVIVSPLGHGKREIHVTSSSYQAIALHAMHIGLPATRVTSEVSASHPFVRHLHKFIARRVNRQSLLDNVILLESAGKVTVILYSHGENPRFLFSQLVYPSNVWSYEYYVYTPDGPLYNSKNLVVPLEEGETLLQVKRLTSKTTEEKIVLEENKPTFFRHTKEATHVLASKKIAIFRRIYFGAGQGAFVHTYLPIEMLSNRYFIPPVVPLYSMESLEYNAISVKPDSALTYRNGSNKVGKVKLQNAGKMYNWTISPLGSQIIGTEPFYLEKAESISQEQLRACPMPILPETLWDTSYHFTASMGISRQSKVYVTVIYSSNVEEVSILLDGGPVTNDVCPKSRDGDDFKSCYFYVGNGYHSLSLKSGNPFMAYMFGMITNKYFCHPLGLNKTEPTKINTTTTTTTAPETSELTTEVLTESATMEISTAQTKIPTTAESTTMEISTAQTKIPTTAESTTMKISTPETEMPTTNAITTMKITTPGNDMATTNEVTTMKVSTPRTDITTTTETTSPVYTDPPLCQTTILDGKTVNDTKTREEVKKLRVNVTRTSSNQRKKTSAPDSRQSSQAIGLCGAVLIGSVVFVVVVPDVYSFLKYFYNLC